MAKTKPFSSKTGRYECPNVSVMMTKIIMAKSVRHTSNKCMLATAIRSWAAKKGWSAWSIVVSSEVVSFNLEDSASETGHSKFMWQMPAGAAYQLKIWDDGKNIAPFRFVLKASQGTRKPVNRRMSRKSNVVTTAVVDIKSGEPIKVEKHIERKKRKTPTRDCVRRWAGLRIVKSDGSTEPGGHVNWRRGSNT